MLKSLNIPRKLGLSFLVICLSAAIVMAIFFVNIGQIRSTTASNNEHQRIHALALDLETQILRQNSQFRGFLVTGDPVYLNSYFDGRDKYDTISAELEAIITDPEQLNHLLTSREETLKWRRDWGDRMIAMVKSGERQRAQDIVRDAGKDVLVSAAVLPLRDFRAEEIVLTEENSASQESAITVALVTLIAGGILLIAIASTLAILLSRSLARPITLLTQAMGELAAGNENVDVPEASRQDELGDMARAVVVFRDAAKEKVKTDREREEALRQIGQGFHRLAEADLTVRLTGLPDAFAVLAKDFNDTMNRLSGALLTVRGSADSIELKSAEVRQAASDLALRTEQQAASLNESTTALSKITQSVEEGVKFASNADREMIGARQEAEQGGEVARRAVDAMHSIDKGSQEIKDIISLIDGIAFQTNLLALNAGVEAARAGEAGKGFAVVASEVRALAQRAAEAAQDVKARVESAERHVGSGVDLVGETGAALSRIIERVTGISEAIASMASSSKEQSAGLSQVNAAIAEMDSATQRNAAMVEETTAATNVMASESEQLAQAIGIFTMDGQPSVSPVQNFTPRVTPKPQTKQLPVSGNLALKADEDDWSQF